MPSKIGPSYRGDWHAVITSSAFLSAAVLGDKHATLRINDVRPVEHEAERPGDANDKTLGVFFDKTDKALSLNRTNAELISAMFGDQTEGWIGHRITLASEMVRFGSKTVPGIRVIGSPDIEHEITVQIKMPRKRPDPRVLHATGRRQAQRQDPEHEQADGAVDPT